MSAVMIEAQTGRRFVLASPRLDLEATRFAMNRRTGKGQIEGEGRMRLGGADGAAVQVNNSVQPSSSPAPKPANT